MEPIITFKEDLSWPQEPCDKQRKIFKCNDLLYYPSLFGNAITLKKPSSFLYMINYFPSSREVTLLD